MLLSGRSDQEDGIPWQIPEETVLIIPSPLTCAIRSLSALIIEHLTENSGKEGTVALCLKPLL